MTRRHDHRDVTSIYLRALSRTAHWLSDCFACRSVLPIPDNDNAAPGGS